MIMLLWKLNDSKTSGADKNVDINDVLLLMRVLFSVT